MPRLKPYGHPCNLQNTARLTLVGSFISAIALDYV